MTNISSCSVEALESDPEIGGAFDNTEYFRESKEGEISEGLIVPEDSAKILSAAATIGSAYFQRKYHDRSFFDRREGRIRACGWI